MKVTWKEANFYDYRFEYGFNVIPIKEQQKRPPLIRTKKYQSQQVTCSEISTWFKTYGESINLGIITGQISRLAVVDVDDLSLLPVLMDKMPEVGRTAAVKTPNGAHFYFLTDKPVQTTYNFLDLGIKLRGDKHYVVAPVSVVNGIPYLFRSRLDHLQPFPERFLAEVKPEIQPGFHLPQGTATQGASCIYQIADRDLVVDKERDLGLFVFHNLLMQNGNKEDFVKAVIQEKNKSLSNPLSAKELKYVWKKKYKHSCQYVRETLPFIKCENCKYLDRRCKVNNLLIQNHDKLQELSGTEHKILNFLQYYFDGEQPSISKLSRVGKIDWQVTKDALGRLKKKGILK